MRLSVLDLSPIPDGGTAADAYANTVDVATQAESLGCTRFWVAEHHARGDRLAGTTPEVLLGNLAAQTDLIRLGSGAVLLNHYAPFKVAEWFAVLNGLAPGRIDAGLGRANGPADRALGTSRYVDNPDQDHADKIQGVINHLYDAFPDNHPHASLSIPRAGDDPPTPWVLGSSPASAQIAGQLGLRYCFAAFIRPQFAEHAVDTYRDAFDAAGLPGGIDSPEVMVAQNAICAATDEEAARRRAVAEVVYRRLQRGDLDSRPSVEEALAELGGPPDPTPETLDEEEWPRAVSGSPGRLASILAQLADRVGADEVMLYQSPPNHAAVLESHRRLADEFDLDGE